MSRREGGSFATLARLKGFEEQTAAKLLKEARDRLDRERENLTTVEQYLSDYSQAPSGDGIPSRLFAEAQRFRLRLEQTVEAQRRTVAHAEQHAERARAHWAGLRAEREAIDRLMERRGSDRARRDGERDQRQSDELALRAPAGKADTRGG